jgi:hypothetical protein
MVGRFDANNAVDQLLVMGVDVFHKLELRRAGPREQPLRGRLQGFDNLMEKALIARCSLTRNATGAVMEVMIGVLGCEVYFCDRMAVKEENPSLLMV